MVDEHSDVERRLSREIKAYLANSIPSVDPEPMRRIPDERSGSNRRGSGAAQASVLVVLVAAIAVVGRPLSPGSAPVPSLASSPPSQSPTGDSAEPTATVVMTPTTSVSPTVPLTERERSDQFWAGVSTFTLTNYRYANLREITADAHLIIRGRVVGSTLGQIQSFEGGAQRSVVFGVVAVDEVLKGEPATKAPRTILVARLGLESWAESDLPSGEVVLFLLNYAQVRRDEGYEPSSDVDDKYYYVRPNGYQCVLRNIDGLVQIVDGPTGWEDALGPFPSGLDETAFTDTVDRIRSIVAE